MYVSEEEQLDEASRMKKKVAKKVKRKGEKVDEPEVPEDVSSETPDSLSLPESPQSKEPIIDTKEKPSSPLEVKLKKRAPKEKPKEETQPELPKLKHHVFEKAPELENQEKRTDVIVSEPVLQAKEKGIKQEVKVVKKVIKKKKPKEKASSEEEQSEPITSPEEISSPIVLEAALPEIVPDKLEEPSKVSDVPEPKVQEVPEETETPEEDEIPKEPKKVKESPKSLDDVKLKKRTPTEKKEIERAEVPVVKLKRHVFEELPCPEVVRFNAFKYFCWFQLIISAFFSPNR